MRRAALTLLIALCSGAALANSGHGGLPHHWHGIETLLLLLVAAILGVLLTRR